MAVRVEVAPAMLAWARQRSGHEEAYLIRKFPQLNLWERGELFPTLKQLEDYARTTYTSIGYFFLQEPPTDRLPIPDFRTMGDERVAIPSPHLLEMIAICQERQAWYRDYMLSEGEDPVTFVGSLTEDIPIEEAADQMRSHLGFDVEERDQFPTWSEALGRLSENAEAAGVLVMISSIVGSNTHRKLDSEEFRGFALADPYAPLVFINGADTKAAQIFTLAHELAHVWLGQSAVSNSALDRPNPVSEPKSKLERWCNAVAAELLVPLRVLLQDFRQHADLTDEVKRLAKRYKVSTLVVLRRVFDASLLDWNQFRSAYDAERDRVMDARESSGGNFYHTQPVRVSKRFARAIIAHTLEGQTPYRDAFRLLGFRSPSAFEGLGRTLGVL